MTVKGHSQVWQFLQEIFLEQGKLMTCPCDLTIYLFVNQIDATSSFLSCNSIITLFLRSHRVSIYFVFPFTHLKLEILFLFKRNFLVVSAILNFWPLIKNAEKNYSPRLRFVCNFKSKHYTMFQTDELS